jgi:autotransporter-associated beta strand protein
MKKNIAGALAFSMLFSAQAATYIWDGGGVNAGLGTLGNWVGDAVIFDNAADLYWYATGTPSGRLVPYMTTSRTVRSINMTADADSSVGIKLDNNSTTPCTLTLSGNGLGSVIAIDIGAAGNLIIGDSVYGDVLLGDNLAIAHNGSGTLTIARPISGAYSITKNGTGTFVLSASNTYSSGTTVNVGILQARADHALGAGNVIVANGAALMLTGGLANDYINNKAKLILGSSSTLTLDFTGTADTVLGISLDGGATWLPDGVYDAATLTGLGSGVYSGNGSFNVVGVKKTMDLFLVTSL